MTDKNALDELIESNQSSSNKKHTNYLLVGLGVALLFVAVIATTLQFNNKVEAPAKEVSTLTPEQTEQLREEFKATLLDAEAQTNPIINDQDYANLHAAEINNFDTEKANALAAFANSEYHLAIDNLTNSAKNLLEHYQDYNNLFNAHMKEVERAFNSQNYNKAQIELNKALVLKPSSRQAAKYQQDLTLQPILAKLYNQLSVAQTENNLDKQISVLKQILTTDPEQAEAKHLLQKATTQKRDTRFANLIKQGLDLVRQGDVKAAESSYIQARSIYSSRPELKLLSKRLSRSIDTMTQDKIHAQLANLIAQDKWTDTYFLAQDAAERFSTDAVISDTLNQAKSILGFQQETQEYLQRPNRLRDSNVQSYAKKLLADATPFTSLSPSLSADLQSLESLMEDANTLVSITITSDRKTNVAILGYGSLGKFKKKTVQLSSGDFTLLGTREGYAVKRTSFTVSKNNTLSLEMICNERI